MDIVRIFKAFFVALSIVLFVFVVASAYRQYSLSTELATLSDGATSIATQLALDNLAFVDEAGKHPYVIDLNKLGGIENFTRVIGDRTYEFQLTLHLQRAGGDDELGPYGNPPPEERMRAALVLPTTVYENGHLRYAKLEVIVWPA